MTTTLTLANKTECNPNIICDVNEEFLHNLLSLRYSNLNDIQKEVLNGVMNVIAELKNNQYQGKKFPKKSDADTIHQQGTEQIRLKNNDTVIAIHEIHQSTDIAHRNGVEHIVWKEEQYLRCATCNLTVKERDNFYIHRCTKHMKVNCMYHCSNYTKEFSNDHNKKTHELRCTKKVNFKCKSCPQVFSTVTLLEEHNKKGCSQQTKKIFEC